MDGMRPELASDLKVKVLILFVHHTLKMVSYGSVSYTHLDVYKRQTEMNLKTKVLILLVARNPNSWVFNLCIIAL